MEPVTPRGWFVTGTDTGVGKTRVACTLLHQLRRQGWRAVGMKPVASGATRGPTGWVQDDVEALIEASSPELAGYRDLIGPLILEAPLSPHLAARRENRVIDLERLKSSFQALQAKADVVIVEGAGGWRVPLGPDTDMADLAVTLGLPVILVVGLRLGCINHARLSVESILGSGVPWGGWIANHTAADLEDEALVLETLRGYLPEPCRGVIPFDHSPRDSPGVLSIEAPFLRSRV